MVVVYDVNPVHRSCKNDVVLDEAVLPGGPMMRVRKQKKSWCLRAAAGFFFVLSFFLLAAAFCPPFRQFLKKLYDEQSKTNETVLVAAKADEMAVQDDWIFFPSTNSLYHVVNGSNTWNECHQSCLSLSSHLTSIHTLAENEFVSNLTAGYQNQEDNNIWLGITLTEEGELRNVDKSVVDFINFEGSHLQNGVDQICVEMHAFVGRKGKWDFMECSAKLKNCICKRLPFIH